MSILNVTGAWTTSPTSLEDKEEEDEEEEEEEVCMAN
jgi:hypothetical protein